MRVCELTGRRNLVGNLRSKSLKSIRRVFKVNLFKLNLPFLNRKVKVKISAKALRTLHKAGSLGNYLKISKTNLLSSRMAKLRKEILSKDLSKSLNNTPA